MLCSPHTQLYVHMLYLIMGVGCKEGNIFMYSNIGEHAVESAHAAYTACAISSNRLHVLVDLSK